MNAVVVAPFSAGRIIPRRVGPSTYTWYPYTVEKVDGTQGTWGHVRPGAYVEGAQWLMDAAYDESEPIYTVVSLSSLFTPNHEAEPFDGHQTLPCSEFRAWIEEERTSYAALGADRHARIPPVKCEGQPKRAFFEWNVWYVVQALRDHPGLLGWYLWDEPEGAHLRHLFGIARPDRPVPAYTGPASLPTPDFLRYTYELVKRFEVEGKPQRYRRHPVIVDLYQPEVFFSNRFSWSRDGLLDPNYHSGPFDRHPNGGYQTPADIVGLDASNQISNPGSGKGGGVDLPLLGWWSDQNVISFRAEAIAEAVKRDRLWSGMVVQAQAQLTTRGPFELAEPLRCDGNAQLRTRLLNDRDLAWHLLTLQAEGLQGQLYYAHNLIPEMGPGAEMERRIYRLMTQFRVAELDGVFVAPPLPGLVSVEAVTVRALTNYYRSSPDFVGPIPDDFAPGRSTFAAASLPRRLGEYTVSAFGRARTPEGYGEPISPNPLEAAQFSEEPLLRTSVRRFKDALYLVVSNVYDARIRADVRVKTSAPTSPHEGLFDLDASGAFRWASDPARVGVVPAGNATLLRIALEPYEARLFRLG